MTARLFFLIALLSIVSLNTPAKASEELQATPFMAQVVGLQWLNPLQRRDYPAQWQLLWTLGLVQPNADDDMVKAKPDKYTKLQAVSPVVGGNKEVKHFAATTANTSGK